MEIIPTDEERERAAVLKAYRARITELEDIVEALRIGEAVLNRALKSEVDLRNEVYTERVAIAEARADTATRALADAIECVEAWSAYAGEYFQEKHDLAGDLSRLRAVQRMLKGED